MAASAGLCPSTAKDEREYPGSTSAQLYRRLRRHHSRTQAECAAGYTAIEERLPGRLDNQAGTRHSTQAIKHRAAQVLQRKEVSLPSKVTEVRQAR